MAGILDTIGKAISSINNTLSVGAGAVGLPGARSTSNLGANTAAGQGQYMLNGVIYNSAGDPVSGAQSAPAPPPRPPNTKTGSGGSGVSSYAASLKAALPNSIQNLQSTAAQAAAAQTGGYQNNILDYLAGLQSSQNKINTEATNAELAKMQATTGVNNTVGQGIQNAGKLLASRNAGDSSAAQEFAREYGVFGRQQLQGVGNQKAQADNAISQDQNQYNTDLQSGLRNLGNTKNTIVNNIVSDATNRLTALQDALVGASLPDKINIAQQISTIKANALTQLSQYDAMLNQGVAGVQPTDQNANIAKAQQLAVAGTPSPTAFNFQTQAPTQLQGTGPTPSSLPIYTFPQGTKKVTG